MVEYINREDVIDALYAKRQDITNIWCRTAITECVEEIQELPSADVQPVKHGYWKYETDYCIVCSECGNPAEINCITGDFMESPYCNGCGAKMDGE